MNMHSTKTFTNVYSECSNLKSYRLYEINCHLLLFLAQEKDKDKDKRTVNGHQFTTANTLHPALCQQCNKALNTKEAVHCTSKTDQSEPAIVSSHEKA